MGDATESRSARALSAFLAGLQAGMLGVCWMLAWMGASDIFERRSFWTAENLMASVFHGNAAIRRGFAASTVSGLALYLLLYSLLGAGFAMAVRDRLPRVRVALASMVFALCWYYVAFHVAAKSVAPLIALWHAEVPAAIGHVIYGAFLGRYPLYLPRAAAAPSAPPAQPVEPDAPANSPPAAEAPFEAPGSRE